MGFRDLGKIKLLPKKMGISLMTMSGHKIYAPKGVGALYISNREISIVPLIHGGAQEYGLRAGNRKYRVNNGLRARSQTGLFRNGKGEQTPVGIEELFFRRTKEN